MPEFIDPTIFAYDLAVMAPDSTMYHLPHSGLVIEETASEMATVMRARLPDVHTSVGKHMAELVPPGTRYYVSVSERGPVGGFLQSPNTSWGAAWDPSQVGTPGGIIRGASARELTRGMIQKISRAGDSAELEIEGSDNLHALLEHDIDLHINLGDQAKDVLTKLFEGWGSSLGQYDGPNVELPEKTFRGERASKVIDEILAFGPRQGVGQFLLRAEGDHFNVVAAGLNDPVYWLRTGAGAGVSKYTIDISEIVGNVIVHTEIDRPEGENAKAPIVLDTTVEGATQYGGATRIIMRDEKSTQAMSQLEAEAVQAKYGFPQQTFDHVTFDMPFIHKYDKLRITDRIFDGYFIVAGVAHDASSMKMNVNLLTPEDFVRHGTLITLEAQLADLKNEQEQLRRDQSPSSIKKLGKREFNRDIPAFRQAQDWTCSAASLAALHQMCWVDMTEAEAVENLGAGINSSVGLASAAGGELVRVLKENHITATAQPLASSQYEQALSIFRVPDGAVGMMGGQAWNHWTAVRGADAAGIHLMNPAPGYKGVDQTLSRADFERLGPWNLVFVRNLPKDKTTSGEDASKWELLP